MLWTHQCANPAHVPSVLTFCAHDCVLHPNAVTSNRGGVTDITSRSTDPISKLSMYACHNKEAHFGKTDQRQASSTEAKAIHEATCWRLTREKKWPSWKPSEVKSEKGKPMGWKEHAYLRQNITQPLCFKWLPTKVFTNLSAQTQSVKNKRRRRRTQSAHLNLSS